MSVHKFQLHISRRAKRDLYGIINYTRKTWGERQMLTYRDKIYKVLNATAADPYKGKEYNQELRSLIAEKHKIFYCIKNKTVFIVRILHQRMDADRHLR